MQKSRVSFQMLTPKNNNEKYYNYSALFFPNTQNYKTNYIYISRIQQAKNPVILKTSVERNLHLMCEKAFFQKHREKP